MPKLETRNSKYEEPSSTTAIRICDFKDLQVWQLARDLRREAYNLVRRFPSEEKYALANQVRRAAISVTANIAEGFGRYHYQENIQFCRTGAWLGF
jgi:23S rRNA-intervening sequence protein